MASDAVTATGQPPARTRPRNRRQLIIDAATLLFHRDGYHRVGMEDIAAAVGITSGALYRHFRSKQDLLAEALLSVTDVFLEDATAAVPDGVDAVCAALAGVAVARRDRGPSWQRHARDLSPEHRTVQRRKLRMIASRVSGPLLVARPELKPEDADLLAWAVMAVLGSVSEHGVVLARPPIEEVLTRAARAVWTTKRLPVLRPAPAVPPSGPGLAPASRREVLLATAARLFREHGYDAVKMETIGAAAGIAGPSIYNHFPSKLDLLMAVLDRGKETLQVGLRQALAQSTTAEEALEPVVRSYVGPCLMPDGLPSLFFGEAHRLPDERREAGRRDQREYIGEWVRLLPTGQAEGRVVVHAALGMVNSLSLIPHLTARPGFADLLIGLVLDVLHTA